MKKNIKKKFIPKKKNYNLILIFIFSFLLVMIISLTNPKITQYAIKEDTNYSTNLILEIPNSHKNILDGESVWVTLKLLNLASKGRIDVVLKYEIINSDKEVIFSKSETVAIETTASFVRQIEIPKDSPKGKYNLIAKVIYSDGKEIFAEDTFNVINVEKTDFFIYVIILSIIISIILVFIFIIKTKPLLEKIRINSKIHNIVKNKR
jgi:hypothetical protein